MRISDRIRAFFRGERKIKNAGRGRCLERKNGDNHESGKPFGAKATPEMTLKAKVTRVDGSIEHYDLT